MATYNGALYLREQVESILAQLEPRDELVVVDDCSSDTSVAVLRGFGDPRVSIHINEVTLGVCASFQKALTMASGELLSMADQDDIWPAGRVAAIKNEARWRPEALLISGRIRCFKDDTGERSELGINIESKHSNAHVWNLIRIIAGVLPYLGCGMTVRRELLRTVLPIPTYVESHDLWIAIAANIMRRNSHLDVVVVERRVHGANVSLRKRPLWSKLKSRWIHLRSTVQLLRRTSRRPSSHAWDVKS